MVELSLPPDWSRLSSSCCSSLSFTLFLSLFGFLHVSYLGGFVPFRLCLSGASLSKSLLRYVNLSKATIYSQIFDMFAIYIVCIYTNICVLYATTIGKITLSMGNNQLCSKCPIGGVGSGPGLPYSAYSSKCS